MIAILRHMLQPDSTICRRTAIKTRGMPVDISLADRDTVLALTDELVAVYARTFGAPGYDERPEAIERFRSEQLPRHADRDGFRCALARRDGRVVGFAYGYTGQRGQWWPEHVASHAPEDVVRDWLGGHFEFVELAVEPAEIGAARRAADWAPARAGPPDHVPRRPPGPPAVPPQGLARAGRRIGRAVPGVRRGTLLDKNV
jgi:hypothetical protein